MSRKKENVSTGAKPRRKPARKGGRTTAPRGLPGKLKPQHVEDDDENEDVVSRSSRVRSTSRGGRGR